MNEHLNEHLKSLVSYLAANTAAIQDVSPRAHTRASTEPEYFRRPTWKEKGEFGHLLPAVQAARRTELPSVDTDLVAGAFEIIFDSWNGKCSDALDHPSIEACRGLLQATCLRGAAPPMKTYRAINEVLCVPGEGITFGKERLVWDSPYGVMGWDKRHLVFCGQQKVIGSLHWGRGFFRDPPTRRLLPLSDKLSALYRLHVRYGETPEKELEVYFSTLACFPEFWEKAERIIEGIPDEPLPDQPKNPCW